MRIVSKILFLSALIITISDSVSYAAEPPSASETTTLLKGGESLLRPNVQIVPSCGGHCIAFVQNEKIGFALNSSNLMVITPAQFEDVYNENFYESNDLAIVKKDGKWGAYNCSTFKVEVPCIYDKLTPFRNGKSTAFLNGETFTIDTKGNRLD